MRSSLMTVTAGLAVLVAWPVSADTVTSFAPTNPNQPGVWFHTDTRPGGNASLENLTGLGGSLENDAPLPSGAALLTTDFTTAAKAEVGVADDYGKAIELFETLILNYSFFKQGNPNLGIGDPENLAAAPSIKVDIFNPDCAQLVPVPEGVNRCFGSLIYEPYWNDGSGPREICGSPPSTNPIPNVWHDVLGIDGDNGCFWWSGGFGQANSAGGPPLRTLSEWQALFEEDGNFAGAFVTLVKMGVGTSNVGQHGYFDKVEISHSFNSGFAKSYDFEAPLPDEDEDGVPDELDFCPGTVLPEAVPTTGRLLPNHFAMTTTGPDFTTNAPGQGARESFTIHDTRGCSCEQIIDHLGLPNAHRRNGCPIGIMRTFIQSLL